MKSILQEGSSVLKAVKKVWEDSGRPQEFTIRVHDFGKKSFFGIIIKPAIVSISYDIKKRTEGPKEKVISTRQQKIIKKEGRIVKKRDVYIPKRVSGWNKEMIDCSIGWLSQIIRILGVKVNFNYKVDNRILNIYISKKFLSESEDEKMFFISLSYLLMQFLKRKFKRRFINYYLIIHIKQS
ncbi:hypothetical protein KAT08_01425 [Candidatus Babeliales bacterium]|nr:hypothetical protein [Candidatus Babeliales bacterium]